MTDPHAPARLNDPDKSIFPGVEDCERAQWGTCGCAACVATALSAKPFPDNLFAPFIVCPDCGNKRCPRATHHDNACTGSNDPGQPGSRYA